MSATEKSVTEKAPISVDEERLSKAEIQALREENRQLAQQVNVLKAALDERVKSDSAKAKAKDDSIRREPKALGNILGVGRRMIKPGDVLFPEELEGLVPGVHYEVR